MSKNTNHDAATFMTPGSVWVRENGQKNILLFISNATLPKKLQAQFPSQAVYLDEEGNVFNKDVEDFLADRTFYNIEPSVETQVDTLLAFHSLSDDEDADAEEVDLELEVEEDGDEEEETLAEVKTKVVPKAGKVLEPKVAEEQNLVTFSKTTTNAPIAFALESAVVGYRQEPLLSHSMVSHIVVIDLARTELTPEQIAFAFDPANPDLLARFSVRNFPGDVDWDTFVGAFPQATGKNHYLTCYFGVSADAQVVGTDKALQIDEEIQAIEQSMMNTAEQPVSQPAAPAPATPQGVTVS